MILPLKRLLLALLHIISRGRQTFERHINSLILLFFRVRHFRDSHTQHLPSWTPEARHSSPQDASLGYLSQSTATLTSNHPSDSISTAQHTQEIMQAHANAYEAAQTNPPQAVANTTFDDTLSRTVLVPIPTASVKRYQRNIVIPQDVTQCLVGPLTLDYKIIDILPGWTPYTHPEGAPYFYHQEKRVFTDAWLYDPDILKNINSAADKALSKLANITPSIPTIHSDFELTLEIMPKENDKSIVGYYFVDHASRRLFWLDEFDAGGICNHVPAVSISHLAYAIEAQYWRHWEFFPGNKVLAQGVLDEVRETTLHAAGDVLTSPSSTAVYSWEELTSILSLLGEIDDMGDRLCHGAAVCFIGRLMHNLTQNKFANFYGQQGARLDHDQSVHGEHFKPRSLFIRMFSPFMFFAPHVYLRALDKIWVDYLVKLSLWKEFINKRSTEWQEFVITGTVLLNANVAFLAIQSVDNTSNTRSPAQIASYVSTVTSLGSIIVALLLVRRYRTKNLVDAAQVSAHLHIGAELLAFFYSLPYALLMWSTLAFLTAFLLLVFSSSTTIARVIVSAVAFVVGTALFWCLATIWDPWKDERRSSIQKQDIIAYFRSHFIRKSKGDVGIPLHPISV